VETIAGESTVGELALLCPLAFGRRDVFHGKNITAPTSSKGNIQSLLQEIVSARYRGGGEEREGAEWVVREGVGAGERNDPSLVCTYE
jgi:hypothetical protein